MSDYARFGRWEAFGSSKSLEILSCVFADADKQISQAKRLLEKDTKYLGRPLVARLARINGNEVVDHANNFGPPLPLDFGYFVKVIAINPCGTKQYEHIFFVLIGQRMEGLRIRKDAHSRGSDVKFDHAIGFWMSDVFEQPDKVRIIQFEETGIHP